MNFDTINPVLWANNAADKFFNTLSANSIEFFNNLMVEFMAISTDICIIAGLIGAILFIFGWKKCRNVPFIAFAIHLIIQILGGVLLV